MKKEECISKFVASLIIAFPFMAMFAFLVELFTIERFIDISKNHGSLIAGLLGFAGVAWAIYNQNISTQKTVNASMNAVREEIQESRNKTCDEYILDIVSAIEGIDLAMKSGSASYVDSLEFINIAQSKIKRLRVLSGKNNFEVNNLVIEGYIDFYGELLATYNKGVMSSDDAAKVLKDLNKKRVSLCSYLEYNRSSFINGVSAGWYWSAIKILSRDIYMQSNTSADSNAGYEMSEPTMKSFYYLLNGMKIQLEYMISSRVSNPFIDRDV